MAIENLLSTQITEIEAGTKQAPSALYGRVRVAVGTVTTTQTTTSSGSTYTMVRVPADAVPIEGWIVGDGTLNLSDVDVGAKLVSSTPQLDDDGFAAALAVTTTATARVLFAGAGNDDLSKKAWQYTAATSKPEAAEVDIEVSLDANATAAGKLTMILYFVVD